jgi:outer membrane protein
MTIFSVRTLPAALAMMAAGLCCAASALADDASGNDVYSNSARIGLYSVFFHASTDGITGPYVPPGASLTAKDVWTAYLAYVRRLSEHFDLELAGGYPPLQKTVGRGPATLGSVPYNGQILGTARWIAPTTLLEYKFLSDSSAWRPYIGVGVNYTDFYDRNSTAQGNAAQGGPTKLSLTSSVGAAGVVGLGYHIAGHLNAYASYAWSQVNTRLNADTAGVIRTTRIDFGPQALILAVGYSF